MPVKKKQTQERRRSTRIQHKEEEKIQEEKKRTNLKDLLKRSNSTTTSKGAQASSIEKDGDFVFKRTGSSQPITDVERRDKSSTKRQRSTVSKKEHKKPIRRLNLEDVTITPQRDASPKKKSRKVAVEDEHYEEHSTSFQIALPTSDTPMIRRNQKFRKEIENGVRRSSLGNRGKRVSSIGNGFTAVPHDKVPTNEFYKHLDSDLPDPHRMRQLLTWVAKRVFEEDKNKHFKRKNKLPTEEITALNIAKVIKEEIVKDLSDGKINISWWNRSDDQDEEDTSINGENKLEKTLVPNEKNVKNAQVLEELKEKLKALKRDSTNWEKHIDKKIDIPIISQNLESVPSNSDEIYQKIVDSSIISELSTIENSTFNDISNNLEKTLDRFNEFIHTLKSSSSLRTRFADLKSKQLAEILDQTFDDDTIDLIKNNEVNKDVDTHQLLQGISRLDK